MTSASEPDGTEEKYLDYLKRATADLRHTRRRLRELEDRTQRADRDRRR